MEYWWSRSAKKSILIGGKKERSLIFLTQTYKTLKSINTQFPGCRVTPNPGCGLRGLVNTTPLRPARPPRPGPCGRPD